VNGSKKLLAFPKAAAILKTFMKTNPFFPLDEQHKSGENNNEHFLYLNFLNKKYNKYAL
jgi:hypothetical protein